jgi:hypothetical protein
MLDWNSLAEISRANCVGICGFLVPANLLTTLLTIILAGFCRPWYQIWQVAGLACIFAFVMMLHVYSWFVVGVVMAPTYILLWLAIICLFCNVGAILFRRLYWQATSLGN